MTKARDLTAIIFFMVWICVGVAVMFFLYNNYNLSQGMMRGKSMDGNQMMQKSSENMQYQQNGQGQTPSQNIPQKSQ